MAQVHGTLLVILYVNDTCSASKVFDCIIFADKFLIIRFSDYDIHDIYGIINV